MTDEKNNIVEKLKQQARESWGGKTGEERAEILEKYLIKKLKNYSEKTGLSELEVLKGWEKQRTYSAINFYQEANQPEINKEERLKEQYAKLHDWEKIDGIKFDTGGLDEDYESVYFDKEGFKSRTQNCTFWQYTVAEENVYDDIDDVIEYIEDNCNVPTFEDYKKSLKSSQTTDSTEEKKHG